MSRKHRLGVNEATLVTRKLRLTPGRFPDVQKAIADIDRLYGLDGVSFNRRRQTLRLAYDASRIGIERVEEILAKHDMHVSRGWWNRTRANHYRFVDQNIKDNAATEPWSCH
ncbi:hypothetical protein GCM10022228_23610 [Halomonas cibimaris]|uniref:Uncharacterized protein n=1 Tax=Halomonas cibimaris TaxID=657012 RepID=A0ABP7M1V9_9GAMM